MDVFVERYFFIRSIVVEDVCIDFIFHLANESGPHTKHPVCPELVYLLIAHGADRKFGTYCGNEIPGLCGIKLKYR